jgi:hypothetical protein
MYTPDGNHLCPEASDKQQVRLLVEKVEELLVRAHCLSQTIERRVQGVLDDLPELTPNHHPGPANGTHRSEPYWGKEKRPG